jgi:F-type H+-transporting ATPase subunit a
MAKNAIISAIFMAEEAVQHSAEKGVSIHLAPDVIGHVYGVPITNTTFTVWCVMLLLVVGALLMRRSLSMIPGKVQVLVELLIGGAYDYIKDVLESDVLARKFFPLIMTIFLFILGANWFGLLPGVTSVGFTSLHDGHEKFIPFLYPANTDLNVTIALSIIAFLAIEIAGFVLVGFLKYAGKFVNFKSPLGFFIGIIELFSELARLVSFSFRLFGNIFAGKVLLLITIFFVPFILPVPIMAFELFVGFIQAFVFAVLTLFFIKLAVTEPH